MEQNPYESPAEIDTGVPPKTIFTPWVRKWGGPIAILLAIAGMICMHDGRPTHAVFPAWTYPIFAVLFVAFFGGIVATVIQVGTEIMDFFR